MLEQVDCLVWDFDGVIFKPRAVRQDTGDDYLFPDTLALIRRFHGIKPQFIASGAEQVQLRACCEQLGIAPYFQEILGGPTPKTELLYWLLQSNNLNPGRTLMIGDSVSDWESALKNHMLFLGVRNESLRYLKPSLGYYESLNDWR